MPNKALQPTSKSGAAELSVVNVQLYFFIVVSMLYVSGGRTSDYKVVCHSKLVTRRIEEYSIEGKEPKAFE